MQIDGSSAGSCPYALEGRTSKRESDGSTSRYPFLYLIVYQISKLIRIDGEVKGEIFEYLDLSSQDADL